MFSSTSIGKIAEDFAGISKEGSNWHVYGEGMAFLDYPSKFEFKKIEELRGFVALAMLLAVLFICSQCWFFEIIYRFYHYLEDRESSFAFNLESEFQVS